MILFAVTKTYTNLFKSHTLIQTQTFMPTDKSPITPEHTNKHTHSAEVYIIHIIHSFNLISLQNWSPPSYLNSYTWSPLTPFPPFETSAFLQIELFIN